MGNSEVRISSSATYKWGVLCLVEDKWLTAGFFKTEKAAKRHALAIGGNPVLIARRFDRIELRGSRGVA